MASLAQGFGIAKKGFDMVAKAWHKDLELPKKALVWWPRHGTCSSVAHPKRLYCQNMAQVVGICC